MNTPHAALVPFYLKLYDDVQPQRRQAFDPFLKTVADALGMQGVAVRTAPVCRVAGEFAAAVAQAEREGADCLVTLHLAYSPSLEALDVFRATPLPVVILDTTMDARFGVGVSPERIMYNHGIHGVMDFASMLRRVKRLFDIVAGSVEDPGFFVRAADHIRAAAAARSLRGSRVLRVGHAFAGMGDFAVPEAVMRDRLGVAVEQAGLDALDHETTAAGDAEVAAEIAADRERYRCELPQETHARSVRVGLGLRRLLEKGGYGGFSVNFQAFDSADRPSNTMPFLEISKAMARGVGYGGEGDVLTAALVGALARAFGATTFTEIFCADWAGDALFLSHMGEISPAVAADMPRLVERPFIFGGAKNPAVLTCAVRPGPATFVNLAPGPDNTFTLLVAPVSVLSETDAVAPAMRDAVRAWISIAGGVAPFLEAYSRAGGTHHSALVLGDRADAIAAFGRLAGLDALRLG
mgnify:CR=1 FL=1